jgi:low temperature requirement protein LtrA
MLALFLGLGFWWIYFDIVGGRKPRTDGRALTIWLLAHLPITGSIAASGAAVLNLIEHASEPGTPLEPAWLLAISTALFLVAEVVAATALADYQRLPAVYRPLSLSMVVAAVIAVAVGVVQPPAWLLAVGLGAVLLILWLVAVSKFMKVAAWPPGRSTSDASGTSSDRFAE